MSKSEKIRILGDIFPLNQVPFDFTSWKKLPGSQLVDSVYVFLALLWNEAMIISKLEKPARKYETSKRRKYRKTNTKIRNRKYKMALCSDDQVAEAAKCGRLLIESTPSAQFSII